ncbi:hypothetical protein K523DRAFT_413930 [Schizophyllum commune Tattone D]|nr:hypothetical protein K523DRAFT_413930 [Schizophyllum commune Tattone D]
MARFFALAALAMALVAHASPAPKRRLLHMPREATRLAADPETGTIYLYDNRGLHLGIMERDTFEEIQARAGGCSDISASEREIKTNNPDFPDKPARVCLTNNQVDITINGDPQCTTQSQSAGGDFSGTTGTVALSQTEGTAYTLSTTTTTEASVALGLSGEVKFGIPDIESVTYKTSLTTTVTNKLGTTESTTQNQQTTSTVTVSQADGQTCQLDFETKSCTTKGSGNLPFLASGWVWFVYKNKTKDHWNWALLMEGYLDEGERSTYMNFDSTIGTETKSNYNVVCQ